jgi:hypothetical protein
MNQEIVVNLDKELKFLDYRTLKIIQGDLKELATEDYIKLKKNILENGVISPIHVWMNPESNQYEVLDGTQRTKTFEAMQNEGYIIPKVPCVVIHAESRDRAVKILLSLVSQYGKTTDQGLYEFVVENNVDLDFLKESYRIPEVDLPKFVDGYFNLESEDLTDQKPNEAELKKCPNCGVSIT